MSAERAFLDHLDSLGVVISTARPGTNGSEFTRSTGWQALDHAGNAARIKSWQPGHALLGVMGGRVAVLDVDTKNGADPSRVVALLDGIGVRVYADVLTPSGGRHFYVAGHPDLPTVHATEGRDGLTGYPGVEVLSYGANAFLPGTARAKYGGAGYVILSDDLERLADGGDEDSAEALTSWVAAHRASRGEAFTPSPPWDGAPPDKRQAAYLEAVLTRQADELAAMRVNSGRNKALYLAGLKCGSFVAGAGLDEAQVVDRLTEAASRCGLLAEDGPLSVGASLRSGLGNGRKNPRAVPDSPPSRCSRQEHRDPGEVSPERALPLLGVLLDGLRTWQHLPDPIHVVVALAVAATREAAGEPCWVLMVAPPSSGKTEAVRILDDAADARLDEVTAAGLLGWSKGKDVHPTGVLTRIGERALITFGDLSSLLATSDRGGRDQVFGLLRRAYDGNVFRDVSPPGRTTGEQRLEWAGRLTVVASVTQAIDRFSAHSDALGPRWVYVRIAERSTSEKRTASRLARRSELTQKRQRARQDAHAVLLAAGALEDALPDDVADSIEDAALVTAWGRAAVPRNGYGRREIEGVSVIEEPMRLVQQLSTVARGVLALGLPPAAATAIARRVALDSMPSTRRAVLDALSTGEVVSTAGCARAAGLDRKVARMTLEELAAVGIVENDRAADEDDEPSGTVNWALRGDDGDLVAAVMRKHDRFGGWDETWVYTSTSPPEREKTGIQPTLRPTPDGDTTHTSSHPLEDQQHCSDCGAVLSQMRAAYGKSTCVDCERRAAS